MTYPRFEDLTTIADFQNCISSLVGPKTCFCPACRKKEHKCIKRIGDTGMNEAVNHPKHYFSEGGLEVIDVIEDFDLNFNLGNAIKYILRAGKKDDEKQELKKALWYLRREIKTIEEEEEDE